MIDTEETMEFFFNLASWLEDHGPNIIRIIIYGIIFYWLYRIFLWRILKALEEKNLNKKDKEVLEQRVDTLNSVLSKTGRFVVTVAVLLSIISETGINIAPMLAGFGIIGIAFGFGAQGLIKDIVNGMFIIAEGQYSKGDIVEISEKKGQVEKITLRRTVLRDIDGTVHHIPNSLVGAVSNKSQEWAGINLNVSVDCKEDAGKVIGVLEKVGKELYKDKIYSAYMLEEPQVLGIDSFSDGKATIKIIGKTKHLKRWEVTRELRKRIKEEFDKEKIKLV